MTSDDASEAAAAAINKHDEPALASAAPGVMPFEGVVEFTEALRRALQRAADSSTRRLCWSDADFAAWPLGDKAWIAELTRWARSGGRELVMIAGDYLTVERRHPRFASWRREWAHVIQCRVPDESRTLALPTLWVDSDHQALRVFDHAHWRGRAGSDRVDWQRAREDFDAILQRAIPGFSASTLGL